MTKPSVHPNAVLYAGVALCVLLASCSPRSCEDAESEYHSRLEECEVDFFFDSSDDHVCNDVQRQFIECKISCLDAASCEAVRGEGGEESRKVIACQDYCQAFTFQAIPDEEISE